MKNNVRTEYQITTDETHTLKLHISKGNGPNQTLQQLIPHTIIPYKAPYGKRYIEVIHQVQKIFIFQKNEHALLLV